MWMGQICEEGNKWPDSCEGNPKQPFVAILAGAKYDTKIGPLKANVQESAQGNSCQARIQHLPLWQIWYQDWSCGGKASLHKKIISVLMTDLHATCPVGFLTVLFVRSFVLYIVLETFLGVYVLYGKWVRCQWYESAAQSNAGLRCQLGEKTWLSTIR
jgi:hypothetical protein